MKYTKTTFTPSYMGKPMQPVSAHTNGIFTIYQIGKGWRIHHASSDLDLFQDVYATLKGAKYVINKILEDYPELDWTKSRPFSHFTPTQARALKAYSQLSPRK